MRYHNQPQLISLEYFDIDPYAAVWVTKYIVSSGYGRIAVLEVRRFRRSYHLYIYIYFARGEVAVHKLLLKRFRQ